MQLMKPGKHVITLFVDEIKPIEYLVSKGWN
jgi:hypothetical protein